MFPNAANLPAYFRPRRYIDPDNSLGHIFPSLFLWPSISIFAFDGVEISHHWISCWDSAPCRTREIRVVGIPQLSQVGFDINVNGLQPIIVEEVESLDRSRNAAIDPAVLHCLKSKPAHTKPR